MQSYFLSIVVKFFFVENLILQNFIKKKKLQSNLFGLFYFTMAKFYNIKDELYKFYQNNSHLSNKQI